MPDAFPLAGKRLYFYAPKDSNRFMTPAELRKALETRGIPKGAVSALAGVYQTELSTFFRDAEQVPAPHRASIERAAGDLIFLVDALESVLPAKFVLLPDWRDIDSLRAMVRYCRDAEYRALVDAGAVAPGMN